MTLYIIENGNFKLDGGAMFGVVPKAIWSKTNPADNNNRIDIAARSLLIENGEQLILIDTGLGNKQSDKFFNHYHRWGNFSLETSLQKHGFTKADVTDVFLTHLHFDHCGGCINYNAKKNYYQSAFKNAKFWSNKNHWQWATQPNAREKASFLKENLLPMQESGQLQFIQQNQNLFQDQSELNFGLWFVNGHTEKMMLPQINYQGKTIVFMADLIPTVGHIPLPYVMGYDTRPLETLKEKAQFLKTACDKEYLLFFQHDAHNQLATLQPTEKGIRLKETYSFNEIFKTQ